MNFNEVGGKIVKDASLTLDNGYAQFRMLSDHGDVTASSTGLVASMYLVPVLEEAKLTASCSLKITGQSQFAAPLVCPESDHLSPAAPRIRRMRKERCLSSIHNKRLAAIT